MNTLDRKAWLSISVLAVAMGALLFLPAGTIRYLPGWGYLAIFFGASALLTIYLSKKDPALLKRRLTGGPNAEKERTQKVIMFFLSVEFLALLVVPALDYRYSWSNVPATVIIAADMVAAVGFYIIYLVYKENTFASARIELAADHIVISPGPYAIVRHPMYAGAFLYTVATPIALGSYWGLLVVVAMLPFLIWRLLDEERFLLKNLPGYTEYYSKTRWRVVPGVF
jgi:protein-S-isoprenylcysteine O-methyltransferase Ste14